MKSLYFDTNIFIYQSSPQSTLHKKSFELMRACHKKNISIYTSAETCQEIMYYMQRTKQLKKGVRACLYTLRLAQNLCITKETIKQYLSLLNKNKTLMSRDALHLASCIEHNIDAFVTHDKQLIQAQITTTYKPQDIIAL